MLNWDSWRLRSATKPSFQIGQYGFISLESRITPVASVFTSRNDLQGTGQNLSETTLSPANVKPNSFGKLFTTPVDGNVYAQPIVWNGIPANARAKATAANVVFVATEHDTLYAINTDPAAKGEILWSRSFLDTRNLNGRINNPGGATSISTLTSADVGTLDISPEIGITGTPVLDPRTATVYLVVKTKAVVGGVTHYIQRLHAINTVDGSDRTSPFSIGDTTIGAFGNPRDQTPIFVYGNGEGNFPDTYNNTNRSVITFNALREHQRAALRLVNDEIYVTWASHGDNGPYHGWVVKWDVSNLAQGIKLSGVLNTSPNNAQSGIWQSGSGLSFEADGSAFYFTTGNGTGGAPILGSDGFPVSANYSEALLKVVADPSTNSANQSKNGWGFRIADYFVPYNMVALDAVDGDFGSGAPVILPDSAGIPGHPRLMIAAGKEGKVYVLDRDNLGKFNGTFDNVVSVTPDKYVNGVFSAPTWYNGALYLVGAFGGAARRITINSSGQLIKTSETQTPTFGNLPGSASISANGTNGGIVWIPDRAGNSLHAYDANSLTTELWNSNQQLEDLLGAVVKFAPPTIAEGQVYVGTTNSLVVYGLKPPVNALPATPTNVQALALSNSSVQLSWTDPTVAPNTPSGFLIEQSLDGVNFTTASTVPPGMSKYIVGGLLPLTQYYFRIRSYNGVGNSPFSTVVSARTSDQLSLLDFSSGFGGASSLLAFNGISKIAGSFANITDNTIGKSGSIFTKQSVDISKFNTQFTFRQVGRGDGLTFTLQGIGAGVIGSPGAGLGYAGIRNSAAIKFDIFSNTGEGPSSTGLFLNGSTPTNIGSVDLRPTIDLGSAHMMRADISYDGTQLAVGITDTVTNQTYKRNYAVNLPAVIGSTNAYVGFTGGTGGLTSVQDVLTWTLSPNAVQPPATPTALGSAAASATSVYLNWTNNASNQSGYQLDRASDPAFTKNFTTQQLPATPANFTDQSIGLAPGNTYYYRIRALNTAGPSGYSNTTIVKIPLSPNRASNPQVVSVTSSQIDLQWTDNAGITASGYRILRAVDRGTFSEIANLPPFNSAPPNLYEWSDSTVLPGHFYEYHIIAYNVAGYNDFVGLGVTTPQATAINFSNGFTGANSSLTANGNSQIAGAVARITDGTVGKAGSLFSSQKVNINQFQSEFTTRIVGRGDGMTFTIQNAGANALGQPGSGLGYGGTLTRPGITQSIAIKLDIFDSNGEGPSSTGLFLNGAMPTAAGSVDLRPAGITLNSGNVIRVKLTYDGTTLNVTITDTVTGRTATQVYRVNIATAIGSSSAYVGFTGASGGLTAVQDVLSWTFSNP